MPGAMDLPDEVLSCILAPLFAIPDATFSDIYRIMHIAHPKWLSRLLRVNKQWLRVARPLLYHTVILRSMPDAQIIGNTLKKHGPALGKHIRRLRIEGGYGASMLTLLKNAPNVAELSLCFVMTATEVVDGMCKGLHLVSPTRLILRDVTAFAKENKPVRKLMATLVEVAAKWDKLVEVVTPWNGDCLERPKALFAALGEAGYLRRLNVPDLTAAKSAYPRLKSCPLESIYVHRVPSMQAIEEIENDRFKSLLELNEHRYIPPTGDYFDNFASPRRRTREEPQTVDPSAHPLSAARLAIQEKIWKQVLTFAMENNSQYTGYSRRKAGRRFNLLLVSKAFHRLGLPLLYEDLYFTSKKQFRAFSRLLQTYPNLGTHVRIIELYLIIERPRGPNSRYSSAEDAQDELDLALDEDGNPRDHLRDVFRRTPNLEKLVSGAASPFMDSEIRRGFVFERGISLEAFSMAGRAAGGRLLELSVAVQNPGTPPGSMVAVPSVLSGFSALRKLVWRNEMEFSTDDEDTARLHAGALGQLQELDVRLQGSKGSFLFILSRLDLPSLRRVKFAPHVVDHTNTFLTKHGNSITELDVALPVAIENDNYVLALCNRRLRTLVVRFLTDDGYGRSTPLESDDLIAPGCSPAKRLEKLVLCFPARSFTGNLSHDEQHEWDEYLRCDFPSDLMPNLKMVELRSAGLSDARFAKAIERLGRHGIELTLGRDRYD
ncbi:hypothetical protein HMN09_01108200 [Mycena chlorophos]|uniref:F-box domain-containing protein n=1 Tax=Mycena chlorophos TaxID=658473 RepID=A0A8H6SCV1_MYCCL|nr:hypothetical protein HMN09_01108200 [Mycena chlorophos]